MLPVETILAVFPSAVAVGNVSLRPLTLCHVTAMAFFGIDLNAELHAGNAYVAAWLLTMTPREIREMMSADSPDLSALERWMDGISASVSEVVNAANRVVNTAFATCVPAKSSEGSLSLMPTGYGWPIELADAVCHEYSVSFDGAMDMPLSRVFGLLACARIRNGGTAGGPDYYERMQLKAIREMSKKKESEERHGGSD